MYIANMRPQVGLVQIHSGLVHVQQVSSMNKPLQSYDTPRYIVWPSCCTARLGRHQLISTFDFILERGAWFLDSSILILCISQGFIHHVKNEHNMWAYIFFLIHLDDTKPNDYTALDLYVSDLVSVNQIAVMTVQNGKRWLVFTKTL